VPPRRLNPKIPRDLETICLKCLEKDPPRRYGSAGAVADDLRRWLDGRPIAARPVSWPEKAWRWCRRRPAIAALAGTLALTLAAGVLGILLLWRRAEADFRTINEVLGQIVDLSAGTIVYPESLLPSLQQARKLLIEVAARRPAHAGISRQLASLDNRLGLALIQERRWDEARTVLQEGLRHWDRIVGQDHRDYAVWTDQIVALQLLSEVAARQERPDEVLHYLRRAVDASGELVRIRPGADSIGLLAGRRTALARALARRGDREQAGSLMAANRRMLDHVPVEADYPHLASYRVLAHWDLARSGASPAPTARDDGSGPPDPLARLARPDDDGLLDGDWAELADRALRSAAPPGCGPAQEAEAGNELVTRLAEWAADQRHCGRLDEARRTAERALALGRLVVGRHPDQAAAHLALCEGYVQVYKNAWKIPDRAAVERNLRLALEAALQAQVLDPNHKFAHLKVDGLRRRLKDLLQPR
jgi:tetratricopeptide (TPR) repeat protein